MNEKLFSVQASEYARYRPVYPTGLFEFIASLCAETALVWDSGTGNGQAAYQLSAYFDKVYATDISPSQIKQAFSHYKIEYKVEPAEECSLPDNSADAVTAATAAHWFEAERYYHRVNRILKPGGVLAIWSYTDCKISAPVDDIVQRFHKIIEPYWDERIQNNLTRYKTQPFPYFQLNVPDFYMEKEYSLEEFMHYLFTWSSTQAYIRAHQRNPLDLIRSDLRNAWAGSEKRQATWKLFMKAGRKPPNI